MTKKKAAAKTAQPKQECMGCGSTDYAGALRYCPHCGTSKCAFCDMGDDVECGACPSDEDDEFDADE